MFDISKKTFIWAITGLILLRFLLVILVMNNIPFTDMQLGGFRPHFNESYMPDEGEFFNVAQGLASGRIEKASVVNIGYPFLLWPIVYFSKAQAPSDITKIVFILQEFLLFPLALILVILIARLIFNSKNLAIISGFLFAIYPWLFLIFGKLIGYKSAVPAFHYQLWIIIGNDYISAFFVYLSFFFVFKWFSKIFNDQKTNLNLIILSVTSAAALLVRMTNIWLILIIFILFLYLRLFKKSFIYIFGAAVFYLPQLVFNQLAYGAPWIYGYIAKNMAYHNVSWMSIFNATNFWGNFKHFSPNYYWLLSIVTIFSLLGIFFLGFRHFYTKNKIYSYILAGWFWSYILFFGSFSNSLGWLRFFIPAVPVVIYFLVASVYFVFAQNKELDYG